MVSSHSVELGFKLGRVHERQLVVVGLLLRLGELASADRPRQTPLVLGVLADESGAVCHRTKQRPNTRASVKFSDLLLVARDDGEAGLLERPLLGGTELLFRCSLPPARFGLTLHAPNLRRKVIGHELGPTRHRRKA